MRRCHHEIWWSDLRGHSGWRNSQFQPTLFCHQSLLLSVGRCSTWVSMGRHTFLCMYNDVKVDFTSRWCSELSTTQPTCAIERRTGAVKAEGGGVVTEVLHAGWVEHWIWWEAGFFEFCIIQVHKFWKLMWILGHNRVCHWSGSDVRNATIYNPNLGGRGVGSTLSELSSSGVVGRSTWGGGVWKEGIFDEEYLCEGTKHKPNNLKLQKKKLSKIKWRGLIANCIREPPLDPPFNCDAAPLFNLPPPESLSDFILSLSSPWFPS